MYREEVVFFLDDAEMRELTRLDSKSKDFLYITLSEFCKKAVIKFINGQREHGGVIHNRPMLVEAEKELIDLLFYLAGAKVRIERGEKEI